MPYYPRLLQKEEEEEAEVVVVLVLVVHMAWCCVWCKPVILALGRVE